MSSTSESAICGAAGKSDMAPPKGGVGSGTDPTYPV
jgi:hypothetical protein